MDGTVVARLAALADAEGVADPANLRWAARAVLDWTGATLVGRDSPVAAALDSMRGALGNPGRCEIVGTVELVDPRTAALSNGAVSHAAEVDDIYRDGLYHPGCPTIAAALAAAQHVGADGGRFLGAIVFGYEVGCQVAACVNPEHYRYWHTTGTVGALGAAAAVAYVLGLDEAATAHALATAATMAAGLQQAFRNEAMSKPMHAGHATDAGLVAGFGAASGLTGALDILEGAAGFGAAMAAAPDWTDVGRPPGRDAWAVSRITVKNHTACGHTFAPIDAALAVRDELGGTDVVRAIEVETAAPAIAVAGNPDPRTEFEAKFSIPYCIGAALRLGSVRLDAFNDEALRDPTIRRLAGLVELRSTSEFDDIFPGTRAARLRVQVGDREVRSEVWTRKGDPDAPLSDAELEDKFTELAHRQLGEDTRATVNAIWSLPIRPDVASLTMRAPT